jgi:hypothetical protein
MRPCIHLNWQKSCSCLSGSLLRPPHTLCPHLLPVLLTLLGSSHCKVSSHVRALVNRFSQSAPTLSINTRRRNNELSICTNAQRFPPNLCSQLITTLCSYLTEADAGAVRFSNFITSGKSLVPDVQPITVRLQLLWRLWGFFKLTIFIVIRNRS